MKTILMLHGLGSTGENSKTCKAVKNYFTPKGWNVITPTWDIHNLKLDFKIPKSHRLIIAGISCGGYLARYLANIHPNAELVLLNPLLDPTPFLKNGQNKRHRITPEIAQTILAFKITKDKENLPITVIVAKDDDLLNPTITIEAYKDRDLHILETGGHRLENKDWLGIMDESLNTACL